MTAVVYNGRRYTTRTVLEKMTFVFSSGARQKIGACKIIRWFLVRDIFRVAECFCYRG